jgi:hypothetical protein
VIWTTEMDKILTELYPGNTNYEISEKTGWTYFAIGHRAKKLKLKKLLTTKQRSGKITPWTDDQIAFLKSNFSHQTNKQLADQLGYKVTVVRNKCRELGLSHMKLQYWTAQQTRFLKDNYKVLGDVEIMKHFKSRFPKNKSWTRGQIYKKRTQLNLIRTDEEKAIIISRNVSPGGPACSILKNSASNNLPDGYVAACIAWRDPELKEEILKHPELINLKRQQIKLSRAIKEVSNAG